VEGQKAIGEWGRTSPVFTPIASTRCKFGEINEEEVILNLPDSTDPDNVLLPGSSGTRLT
jgi:hypothetical protein